MRTLNHTEIQAISGGDLFDETGFIVGVLVTTGTVTSAVMAYYAAPFAMVPAIAAALGTAVFLS